MRWTQNTCGKLAKREAKPKLTRSDTQLSESKTLLTRRTYDDTYPGAPIATDEKKNKMFDKGGGYCHN